MHVYYRIEIGDHLDERIWMLEHDDAQGTEHVDDDSTPDDVAREILANRIADLETDNARPAKLAVRVWRTRDDAENGDDPIGEAQHDAYAQALADVDETTRALKAAADAHTEAAAARARAIRRVVDITGGQSAAARALGISQPTVNAILRRAEKADTSD